MIKLLVTGSRSITDTARVCRFLDTVRAELAPAELHLLHGGAQGVDFIAGQWARTHGLRCTMRRPNFRLYPRDRHRNKAYGVRDVEMVAEADRVVAVWDGKSPGTRLTMDEAIRRGKLHRTLTLSALESDED